jgi:hypothetical protein
MTSLSPRISTWCRGELGLEICYAGPVSQLPRPGGGSALRRGGEVRRLEALATGAVRESATGLGHPREEVGLHGGETCQLPLRGGVQPRAEGVAWVTVCGSRRGGRLESLRLLGLAAGLFPRPRNSCKYTSPNTIDAAGCDFLRDWGCAPRI